MVSDAIRSQVLKQAQGATSLQVAFVGVSTGLLEAAAGAPDSSDAQLAEGAGVDVGYTTRWTQAAYAFELLDGTPAGWTLTELGAAFLPGPGSLLPMAVGSAFVAHMAERAAFYAPSGARPGELVLGMREALLPLFGPMLEQSFGGLFRKEILPAVPAFAELGARGGTALDLGCGNGWYLRALAAAHPSVRGLGVDGFAENIAQARARATAEGLADRLTFAEGDLLDAPPDETVDLVAMNRALHHVWDRRDEVLPRLAELLNPGGSVVLWEPAWPSDLSELRAPPMRPVAFQNLAEHVQGNHFLRPDEVVVALEGVGLDTTVHRFMGGREMVVVGRSS